MSKNGNHKKTVFRCNVCHQNVNGDGLSCSSCEQWCHRTCIPMSKELFKQWSSTGLSTLHYYCRVCYRGFQDYDTALDSIASQCPESNTLPPKKRHFSLSELNVQDHTSLKQLKLEVDECIKQDSVHSSDGEGEDSTIVQVLEDDSNLGIHSLEALGKHLAQEYIHNIEPISNNNLTLLSTASTSNLERLQSSTLEEKASCRYDQSYAMPSAEDDITSYPLLNGFLSINEIMDIIETSRPTMTRIPDGPKINVYYILNNTANIYRRAQGLRSVFPDDSGPWDTRLNSTKPMPIVKEESGHIRCLVKRNQGYFERIDGKLVFVGEDQPEGMLDMKRYYSTLKRDPTCKKHVTWIDGSEYSTAVVEFVGDCSGEHLDVSMVGTACATAGRCERVSSAGMLHHVTSSSGLSTNMVGRVQNPLNSTLSHKPVAALRGHPLPNGFLQIDDICNILERCTDRLDCVPDGIKSNVYFIVDNSANIARRSTGLRSSFRDDYGPWDSQVSTTKSRYYLRGSGFTKTLEKRKGIFVERRHRSFVVIDPPPDPNDMLEVKRFYTTIKDDPQCKKRVTWLENSEHTSAIIEYVGNNFDKYLLAKEAPSSPSKSLDHFSSDRCQSTSFLYPDSAYALKNGFLLLDEVLDVLMNSRPTMRTIPGGRKVNVYFVLDNSLNLERRANGGHSTYPDDCGPWNQRRTSTKPSYYIRNGLHLKAINKKDRVYRDRSTYEVLDPQPTDVIEMKRYYTTRRDHDDCKKRVTWLESPPCTTAVVEYVGSFPPIDLRNRTQEQTSTEPDTWAGVVASRVMPVLSPCDADDALDPDLSDVLKKHVPDKNEQFEM